MQFHRCRLCIGGKPVPLQPRWQSRPLCLPIGCIPQPPSTARLAKWHTVSTNAFSSKFKKLKKRENLTRKRKPPNLKKPKPNILFTSFAASIGSHKMATRISELSDRPGDLLRSWHGVFTCWLLEPRARVARQGHSLLWKLNLYIL